MMTFKGLKENVLRDECERKKKRKLNQLHRIAKLHESIFFFVLEKCVKVTEKNQEKQINSKRTHTHTIQKIMMRDLVYRRSVDSKTLIPFESTLNCFGRLVATFFSFV